MAEMKVNIPGGFYYATPDAAAALGRSVGRVQQMIRAGEIDSIQVSQRAYIIPEREIIRLKKSPPKAGRPAGGAL